METEAKCVAETVEDALDLALAELGVQQDAVEYEVLDEGDDGVEVRVWLRPESAAELAREADKEPATESDDDEPASDEELDKIADAATETIRTILSHLGVEAQVEEYEGEEGELILDIVGPELGILIGRHGKTLDAIQVLVSASTHRKIGSRQPLLVDVEGYRSRRREKLEEIALRAAERAAQQERPVRLQPMNSYERRVVHMLLREDGRVLTASEGEDPFRQVVVSPS